MDIQNAVITHAHLTTEDHGVLSGWLTLDYGGSGQGFGGHTLYMPHTFKHAAGNANYAGHWIFRVLQIAGVSRWENLVGKCVRVQCKNGLIRAIGHIINDEWFIPREEFESLYNAKHPFEIPEDVFNALKDWTGYEPSTSRLARAIDEWLPPAPQPENNMKKFDGNKTLDQIKAQCKELGLHYDDKLLREHSSDFVVITTIEGKNDSGQVLYNTFNGKFFGTTPDGVVFDSSKTDHENEPWFQMLLSFFYVEKPATAA